MRKLKLLMVACTLLLGAGQTWAQIDVTSEYLTNASVTNADGWTKGATATDANWTGAPENVCLNHGWWTSATDMYQTVTLPKGLYRLTAMTRGHASVNSNIYAYDVSAETYLASADVTKNGDAGDNNGWGETSIEFTITESKSIRIGWSCDATDKVWANADYFKLYRLTVADVTSTYITNAGFESSTASTAATAAGNTSNNYIDYTSTGWTVDQHSQWSSSAIVSYGGTGTVSGYSAPATDNNGNTGNTLGIAAGWGGCTYKSASSVTLPAGCYTLKVYGYNNGPATSFTSKNGFITTSGSSYISTKTSFAKTTWEEDAVSFTLSSDTEGKFQIGGEYGSAGAASCGKVFFDNITLIYSPFAEAADYTELSTAISTVEAYTLGFDAGEYASYNVLPILNAAKAINQEANNSLATVRELIDALNAITPNATEVNAFYDGSFSAAASASTSTCPTGWHGSDSHYTDGYWVRLMYSDGSSNTGLKHFANSCAMMAKSTPRYGLEPGYTMPLNADTYYKLSFDFAGWGGGNTGLKTTIVVTDGSDGAISVSPAQTEGQNENGDSDVDAWKTYTGYFKTGDAGNYKLLLSKTEGDGSGYQITYGDMVLKTLTVADATAYYNAVKDEVDDSYDAGANGGSEKTAFKTAIDASAPATVAEIMVAAAELYTLRDAFVAATPKYNALETERASAIALGVSSSSANAVTMTLASQLQEKLQELYVLEDAAVTSGYVVDATTKFGSWTTQNLDTKNDQHWSGTTVTYYDKWQNSGYTSSITSTVTLPAGKYVFKLAARAQTGSINGAFNMSVKVGENAAVYKDFVAKDNSGKGITTSGAVSYSDGEFCNGGAGRGWEWRFIGFELDAEASVTLKGYAQIYANNWVGFSDATLLTTTDNIEICRQLYESSKDAAEAARDNEDYNIVIGTERATLNAAIGEEVPEPVTYSWYQTQKAALDEATAALINAKPAYVALSEVNNTVAAELGVSTVPAATSSSTAADITAALNTQNVDEYTVATTNYTYNATSLLGAWSNAPGNNHGQSWNGTTGDEYYDLYNAAARSMTQTVTLPKAKYVLIAKGRASTDGRLTLSDGTNTITFPHKGNDGKGIETNGKPNFGSGTYSNDGNGNGWEYRFLTFESDGSTPTTLTFNWTTASNNWAGLDDITLLAIPETVTIAEDDTEAPDYSIADVTLTRTLSASYWNTFSVPFDMDIPDGWTVKEFDSATDNVITFKDATTIEAGKPYLVKPTANVVNPTYSSVIVQNTEGSTVGEGDYKFAAQIYNKTLATDGTIAYLATDGKVKKLTSGGLKGLRAYFIIPAGAEARIAFLDDETTGITEMKQQSNSEEQVIYDLNGRRVQNMQKGIYIVNGKKIVK